MGGSSHEVRKTVTVLFCDVTESTELGGRLDPESLRRVMSRYFEEMRAAVERHGGTVEKFIGDAVMAVFGVPVVHEDDAFRAARAALEMREALAALNEELERERGVRLEMRIALNSGEVVAGDPASGSTFVTGDAVNVAKRLEQAAEPGEVLVGELTRRLLGNAVDADAVEPVDAKGKGEPVRAWRLRRVVPDASPLPRRLDTPLVGRAHELALLRHAYERAAAGRSCELFTLVGAAGIGKSRLAHELLDSVRAEATALKGRCLPYGDGITFWPLADAIRDLGGLDALERVLERHDDGVVIRERIRGAVGASSTAAGEETFWAIRKLFEALAAERPLVVCFEDIHWAETTFLELLEYVAAWSHGAPILLLCLTRPELVDRRPTWAAPKANAAVVTLEPLSPGESETLLDVVAGGAALDPAARERIAQAAEGNPLFVEQIAAMLLEEGEGHGGVAIPPSLQVLLTSRLERLEPTERAVLERAAVAGREFWRSAVVELAPPELRGAVSAHLMALLRKGLIRPEPGTTRPEDDAFRFSHVLIRDAAYDGISKELRAELHERFAEWMHAAAGERAAELEEIEGYHLEQSFRYREQLGPVGTHEQEIARRAGELLGGAGRRAFARGDMPAALKLLDRAVSLLTHDNPARLDLTRQLSMASWSIGEVARAEALLSGVIEAAAAAGDRRIEWYALLERAGRRGVLDPTYSPDDLFVESERAVEVFEELGDDSGLASAWRRLSSVAHLRGHFATMEEAVERALVHARRAGDAQEEARCVDGICTALLYGPAPAEDAIARCDSILASAPPNPLLEANVASALCGLHAMVGRSDDARTWAARAAAIYDDLGLRFALVGLKQVTGEAELRAGDTVAAENELRGAHDLVPNGRELVAGLLAQVLCHAEKYEEADEVARLSEARAGARDVAAQVRWRSVRAVLEARKGRLGGATGFARAAVALAEATDALNLHADALVDLAEVLRLAGRSEDALAPTEKALELYARKGNVVSARRAERLSFT